jgi:hypothetical protein
VFNAKPHDRTAELVGAFTIALSGADALMEHLFKVASGVDDPLATAIYLNAGTISRQRDLVREAVKIKLSDKNQLAEALEILAEHGAVHEKRNRLMHDNWVFNPESNSWMVMKPVVPGRAFKVDASVTSVDDDALLSLVDRARKMSSRLIAFLVAIQG